MNEKYNLENRLLVAMPSLKDPHFAHSVVFVCEHTENGAFGIAINIPLHATLGEILKQIDIQAISDEIIRQPVVMGGPVSQEQGFIIYTDQEDLSKGEFNITVSSSKEMLQKIADGDGPLHNVVSLGYASWGGGQLEQEIIDNYWLIAPPDPRVIFDLPFVDRWRAAAALVGVDFDRMSTDVGHG